MLKFAEVNRYQKILIKSSLLLFVLIFVFVFNLNHVKAATQWESDPANCNVTDATNFPGQNCSPTNICGDDSGIAQCYDTPVLAPPSVSATSNTLYSSSYPNGGYIVNCYASVDSTAPYCDNNGSYWCNRSNDCYNNQNRTTVCTADAWATASCGTCRSGFADCDGGSDACEIEFGVTDYPTGANNNYADCTTAQCDSGWLDCDATGPGAGNGCEIQDGSSCTIGGLPGEYNGCSCEVPKQYFETGTDTVYSTSDPLLWGTQYGLGDLIHFGTDLNPDLFMVNNDGAVQMAQITEPTTTIDRLYNVGGDLYWNGSPIGSGSGSEQTLQDVADYSLSTDGYVYADFGASFFEDDGGAAKYEAQPGGFEFEIADGSSGSKLSVKSESSVGADDGHFRFTDYRPTTRGLEYAADYSADFTARSLVDKAYVDGLASGSLWDTDLDTGIQVEETADEDMIRFDIGNSSGTAYPDAMVVNNLGNVGVATSSPTSMFHIDDDPENMNQFKITSGGQRVFHVDMEPSGPGGSIKMGDIDAGTYGEVFTLDHSEGEFYFEGGNVGIDNISPNAILDVGEAAIATPSGDTSIVLSHDGGESYIETLSGDMSEGLLMHGTASATTDSGIIKQIYSNGYTNGWVKGLHIFNRDAEPIIFKTSDTEVARLDASGNLGVGTTSPQSKVDIYAGDLRLSNTSGAGCLRYNNTLNQLEYSNDCTTFNSLAAPSGGGWTDDGSVVRLTTGSDLVGIGNVTPNAILDIGEAMIATPSGDTSIILSHDGGESYIETLSGDMSEGLLMHGTSTTSTDSGIIKQQYSNGYTTGWTKGLHIFNNDTDPILFRVNDNEQMRVVSDGVNFYDELGAEIVEIGNVAGGYDFQVNDSSANRIITQGVSYTSSTAGAASYNIGIGDLDGVDSGTWLGVDSETGTFGLHEGDVYLFNRGLTPAQLNFVEASANGNNYIGFQAPDNVAANVNWVLPNADGSNGDVLGTDGTGNLSWVSSPAPTVANGLYNDAGTIKLGGNLTETTYIDHMGYDFVVREFAGEPATYFSGDNFKIEDTNNDRVVRFGSAGVSSAGLSFESSTNEHNIYYRDNALHITSDNLAFAGLQYAADYSADYTDRSLVDKGYVDGLSAGSAGSGLTWDSGNTEIDLGGSLTESTIIDAGFFQYRVNANNSYTLFNQSNVAHHINDGTDNTNWVQSSTVVQLSGTGAFAGLEYQSDYSANYTNRSLVDKAYVDSLVGGSLWDTDNDTGIQVEESVDEDYLRFDTAGSERLLVDASGNIGIDQTAPGAMLHIGNNFSGSLSNYTYLKLEGSGDVEHNIYSPTGSNLMIWDFNMTGNGGALRLADRGDAIVDTSNNGVTINPSSLSGVALQVNGFQQEAATFNRDGNDGTLIALSQDGVTEGTITVSGNTVSYNAFTGSHYVLSEETITKGMLVELTGKNQYLHNDTDSEILYGVKPATELNSPKILGSYLSKIEPKQKQSIENPSLVMAEGNGDLWVVDKGEDIEAGDYLISSDVEGHAQLVDDNFAVNYVVARAAEDVDWSEVKSEFSDKKHKLISVFFDTLVINTDTVEHMKNSEKQGSLLLKEDILEGDLSLGEVEVVERETDDNVEETQVIKSDMQFGQAVVKSKQIKTKVKFDKKFIHEPIVLLTLASDSNLMRYYVSNVNKNGFTINIYPSQLHDTLINWQALPSVESIDIEDEVEEEKEDEYTIIDAMTDLDAEFGTVDENNLDNNSNVLIIDDEEENNEEEVEEEIEENNEETEENDENSSESVEAEESINDNENSEDEAVEVNEVDSEEEIEDESNSEEENIESSDESASEVESDYIDEEIESELESESDSEEVEEEVNINTETEEVDLEEDEEDSSNNNNDEIIDEEIEESSDETDSLSKYLLKNALALTLD